MVFHQAKLADAVGSFSGASGTSYEESHDVDVSMRDSDDCSSMDDAADDTCHGALAQ